MSTGRIIISHSDPVCRAALKSALGQIADIDLSEEPSDSQGNFILFAVDDGAQYSRPLASEPFRLGMLMDEADAFFKSAWQSRKQRISCVGGIFLPDELRFEPDGGEAITLTEKERDLMLCLANAGGDAVARETLHRDVWGYKTELDTHTLETHIYRLRRKIEPDPALPSIILTEEDGYRLNM